MNKLMPNKVGQAGLEIIRHFEGLQPVIYKCPAGKPTIGFGHVVKEGETFNEPITLKQAYDLLREDLTIVENAIHGTVHVNLTAYQFDALCSFIYNIGIHAWQESTFLKKLNGGEDYYDVSSEFLRFIYIKKTGKRLKGLMRRREAERQLFIKGVTG